MFSFSVEVKNEWSYTSAPMVCLNHMDKQIFTFMCISTWIMANFCHVGNIPSAAPLLGYRDIQNYVCCY